ncbi:hypothetical protein EC973_006237 [Apophysomyces ossiformis]|uniref:Uncharacterized protein n=1 Tax=Apophysomyces ossiformis TaxID=679940 RepID=A0A8H7BEE5_9FUNG|nr:hypothetical protein EC973_006237 [Apophysomyces ossiformis]
MGKESQRNGVRVQRGHRMLDGLSSTLTRKLDTLSRSELEDLRERNEKMLSNPQLVSTLPDKGIKLKDTVQQINELLGDTADCSSTAISEEEKSITRRVSDLKLDPTRVNVRKQSVELANAKAQGNDYTSPAMLQISPAKREMQIDKPAQHQAKVCMISLEESLELQESQMQSIKAEKLKRQMDNVKSRTTISESLADDLSITMSRMQLDPELRTPRPQDDDTDEESDEDEDDSDLNDENLLFDDDEGFEEEEYLEEQRR